MQFQSIVSNISKKMNNPQVRHKNTNRERNGRWSTAEANLFQQLIQRYGKNWKKIHQHMRGRTLSQIRSHAQKFFDKVGHKKMQEYERRAKLLEALETLEKEKRLQQESKSGESLEENSQEIVPKKEQDVEPLHINQEQTLTQHNLQVREGRQQEVKQQEELSDHKQEQTNNMHNSFYQMPVMTNQHGYLMHLIYVNPNAFADYGLNLQQNRGGKPMEGSGINPAQP